MSGDKAPVTVLCSECGGIVGPNGYIVGKRVICHICWSNPRGGKM